MLQNYILRQVVTNTNNDRDASYDKFLAVCSHNQSDEDLVTSIKQRSSFSPRSHGLLMQTLLYSVIASNQERI